MTGDDLIGRAKNEIAKRLDLALRKKRNCLALWHGRQHPTGPPRRETADKLARHDFLTEMYKLERSNESGAIDALDDIRIDTGLECLKHEVEIEVVAKDDDLGVRHCLLTHFDLLTCVIDIADIQNHNIRRRLPISGAGKAATRGVRFHNSELVAFKNASQSFAGERIITHYRDRNW